MSWVSQANLKSIMSAIRNKFTTSDLVIANDAKDTGVELNYTAQDGLVTVSPISTDASVESALHLSNGDDTKKTELTQGTLSYVTGTGDSEAYNYMSLLGNGVTFGKKGGGNVQVGGVADPTDAQQVATKKYVDSIFTTVTKSSIRTNPPTIPKDGTGIEIWTFQLTGINSSKYLFSNVTSTDSNIIIATTSKRVLSDSIINICCIAYSNIASDYTPTSIPLEITAYFMR